MVGRGWPAPSLSYWIVRFRVDDPENHHLAPNGMPRHNLKLTVYANSIELMETS
jgi:hypothetical protein